MHGTHRAAEHAPDGPLDLAARGGVHGEPLLLELRLARLVSRIEGVLEDQPSQAPRLRGLGLVGDLGGERGEEPGVVRLLGRLELLLGGATQRRVGAVRLLEDGGDVSHRSKRRTSRGNGTADRLLSFRAHSWRARLRSNQEGRCFRKKTNAWRLTGGW